jgi:Outer membrane protein
MRKRLTTLIVNALILMNASGLIYAQTGDKLKLDDCMERGVKNYPMIRQNDLINKSKEYNISNVWKGYYPQLSVSGQATYQSDVTKFPLTLPGIKVDPLSKDQYKIIADFSQTIYDGGAISAQSDVFKTNAEIDRMKLDSELHKVKEQVAQLFFGILLINEQQVQAELLKKDLNVSIEKISGALQNGTAVTANLDVLKAELLKSDQRDVELMAAKKSYIDMLGLLLNMALPYTTEFEKPAIEDMSETVKITRAEMKMYAFQQQLMDEQKNLVTSKILPKASLFFQGGYGKPALNQLVNDFSWYYVTGIRFSWAISGLYTFSNENELLEVNKSSVELQKEAFILNTSILLKQQLREIEKLKELITSDKKIIELKTLIKETSKSQLENGIITSSDYIRDLNEEDQAKQNLLIHIIQLLKAKETYKLTLSN